MTEKVQESIGVTIEAKRREKSGKNCSRRLRRTGKIPAVLMDKGQSTAIELDPKWLSKAWKSGKKFDLVLDGVTKKVVIKDLQVDPISRDALHIDIMYAK